MGRLAISLVGLALGGCAQVWGLDETTADIPLPPQASLQLDRLSMGATMERRPADLTGMTATYLIEDAADPSGMRRIPATLADSNDRWTAELPEGVAASVEFTQPDLTPFRRLYTFPNRTLLSLFGMYEHPGPEPAPMTAAAAVQITLPSPYVAGELLRLYAVGPWVYHDFAPPADGATSLGPVTVPYDAANWPTTNSAKPLQRITTADRVVALRYSGNLLTAAGEVVPFDQEQGATTNISVALSPVTQTPLDVKIDPAGTAMRLGMTSPAGASVAMAWSVVAAPPAIYANNQGPVLQSSGIAATDGGMITLPYGNPFTGIGWRSLFTFASNKSRVYMVPPMNLPVTLYAGLNAFDEVKAGLQVEQAAGLPVLVSINKIPLTSDGLTAMLDPATPVELTLVADRTANTLYQFNVYEVAPNSAATAIELKIVYAAYGLEPTIVVPHDVFETGKSYLLRAHTIKGGFPTIADGNLQNRDLPYSVGYLDSGVFTVTAP
ncbi:MAG: hypothetical protein HOV81_28100 [Kofleriaceae bacterium]|nr:hypothetical protein [Kofleriaceae bacterium]